MVGPVATFTASALTELAFKKFLETAAGETAKKFTEAALGKMEELRQKIMTRLTGNAPAVNAAKRLEASQGNTEDLEAVSDYLKIAMREDPQFANELTLLGQEINLGKVNDNSSTVQNIHDNATGYINQIDGNNSTNYIGGTQNITYVQKTD